jgi:glycosyltransferase involved in cell wall biosynthesis
MKILYIGRYCKDAIPNGPEKVAKRIFDNFTLQNKSLFIEYFFDGRKYGFFKKLFGRETSGSVNGSDVCRLGIIPLFFALVKYKPEIIHLITFERFAVAAFFYKMFSGVKIVYTMHGLIVHENKYFRNISKYRNFKDRISEKIFVKKSDRLILFSESFKKLLYEYYKPDDNKKVFIRNGVDAEFYEAGKRKKQPGNFLKVVFIADTERKEKGFKFFRKTLEPLNINVELYIIGKNETCKELLIKNESVIVFHLDKMKPDELAGFLIDKDVFVSAGFYEPFGMTTAECMAAGVIPAVTRETGASELIKNGINGFVFDYGDGELLKNILIKLNDNPELRSNISRESVKIYEVLNWKNITYDYINIYKSIL